MTDALNSMLFLIFYPLFSWPYMTVRRQNVGQASTSKFVAEKV